MLGVLRAGAFSADLVGLENHVNYIHRPGGALDDDLAFGLAAVLSCTTVDEFFRIQSGNTQVSATELRALRLPDAPTLRRIGQALQAHGERALASPALVDEVVATYASVPAVEVAK